MALPLTTFSRCIKNKYGLIPKCCHWVALVKDKQILPMKKISINGTLQGTFAILDIETTYKNESSGESIETTYHFPLEKETTLVKLEA